MTFTALSPLSARGITLAVGVGIGLLWTLFSGDAMRAIVPGGIAGIPYSRSALASFSDVVVLAALLCVATPLKVGRVADVSGLTASVWQPFIVFLGIFAGMGVILSLLAPMADMLTVVDVLWLGIGGPITEEIVYRGLAMGALMRLAGWHFLPAALAPAILFGLGHLAQGEGFGDSAGIMAITALGGLFFGWLFVRWGFNLWPAIFAHVGMNLLWGLFALGDTALGGWLGNGQRVVVVGLIIAATLLLATRKGGRPNPS